MGVYIGVPFFREITIWATVHAPTIVGDSFSAAPLTRQTEKGELRAWQHV